MLALPFVVAIAWLHGLTRTIATFHGTDESTGHVPTIEQFARELPTPDLTAYPVPQTPLFHLLFAVVSDTVGMELWLLRLGNAALSFLAVLVLYRILLRRGHDTLPALAMALVFAVSPYFFGISFLLLTDNLAILFIVLGIAALDCWLETRRAAAFAVFCICVAGATLTRQSSAWLALVGVFVLLAVPARPGARLGGAVGVAAALVPLGALFIAWGALVPNESDARYCAVCEGATRSTVSMRPLLFALAVLGVYAAVLYAPRLLSRPPRPSRALLVRAGAAAAVGAGLLVLVPMARRNDLDAGWLWQVSRVGPTVAGTSPLFWIAVPAGCAAAMVLFERARLAGDVLAMAVLTCFLAYTPAIPLVFQKYVDPFVLLAIALAMRPGDLRTAPELAGAAVLAIVFVLYAATFTEDRNVPASAALRPREAPALDGRQRLVDGVGVGARLLGLELREPLRR